MDKHIKKVVVVTDCKDIAFNEMRWIIQEENKKAGGQHVEIELVAVAEFSVLNAAFLTRLVANYCKPGDVISVVINPQKTRSSRIYGKLKNGVLFFGANTGALTWLLEDLGTEELYEINDPGFISFGGKYVHAPNIANLLLERTFTEFGKKIQKSDLRKLPLKTGSIVHIDNFGLMKIFGETPNYEKGQLLEVFLNKKHVFDAVFAKRMMNHDDREWVLYAGSSLEHMPEIGSVRNKWGYKEISAKIGDILEWKEKK